MLVPDEIVMKVLRDRVTQADCLGGMVLDGFPRTERQAHLLDDCLHATRGGTSMHVFRLIVPEAVIIRRIAGRRTCPTCGCIFSDCSDRIENDLKCDRDGSPLLVREDDKEETVRYRLQIFEQEISALVGHFAKKEKVIEIEADRAVEQVTQAIFARFCPTA